VTFGGVKLKLILLGVGAAGAAPRRAVVRPMGTGPRTGPRTGPSTRLAHGLAYGLTHRPDRGLAHGLARMEWTSAVDLAYMDWPMDWPLDRPMD